MSSIAYAKQKWMGLRRRTDRVMKLGVPPWRSRPFSLSPRIIRSFPDYQRHRQAMVRKFANWQNQEDRLIGNAFEWKTAGFCAVCDRWAEFETNWNYSVESGGRRRPNWREHLICPGCRLNSRMRAVIHMIGAVANPADSPKIYIAEQVTPLFTQLRSRYSSIEGSEYLGTKVPFGTVNEQGVRNEDLTAMSFSDAEFDTVLHFEVMEHVPDFTAAFEECARILKPGGQMLFSAPFDLNGEKNVIRARIRADGSIEHILPPEYHGNPVSDEGSLAFQVFGWELLDQLKDLGFASVETLLYRSRAYGYLGGEQAVFLARKKAA